MQNLVYNFINKFFIAIKTQCYIILILPWAYLTEQHMALIFMTFFLWYYSYTYKQKSFALESLQHFDTTFSEMTPVVKYVSF